MLGRHRLVFGVTYGRLAIDLGAKKELVWAVVPPLLLALAFLSLLLLQEPTRGPVSYDEEAQAPAALEQPYSPSVDWRQTSEGYLSYSRPLR